MSNLDIIRGRQVVVPLTNKSAGSVVNGDVVIIGDATNDTAFTTTTTSAFNSRMVGVAQETITSGSEGRVLTMGYAPLINSAESLTRDHFLFTHTTAKEASGSATRAAGAFGQVLETGTDPAAIIWGMPDATTAGSSLGAWTNYTPTWSAAGGTTTLGNGIIRGRYKSLDANTYFINIYLEWGSTTSTTGTTWTFSLPAGLTAVTLRRQILASHILDSGTDNKIAVATIDSGGTTVSAVVPEGGNTTTGTVPHTWATGDTLAMAGHIEVQ